MESHFTIVVIKNMFAITNRFELVSSAPETNRASLRGVITILPTAIHTQQIWFVFLKPTIGQQHCVTSAQDHTQ